MKTVFLLLVCAIFASACGKGDQVKVAVWDDDFCASGCYSSETGTIRYEYTEIITEGLSSHITSADTSSLTLKCSPVNGHVDFVISPRPYGFVTSFVENNEIHFDYSLELNSQVRLTYECKP
jgi:hypothetical protein